MTPSPPFFPVTFPEQVALAFKETDQYLSVEPQLKDNLHLVRRFCQVILLELVPSYFDSLSKIGYFPFAEASTDGTFAIDLAIGGLYKPAYSCLRSFLELSFVGLHFLALPDDDRSGVKWVRGEDPTPFRARVVRTLQAHPEFSSPADHVNLFGRFDELYGTLSDITHTRGQDFGHHRISKANFPRFVPTSLVAFADLALEAASVVATAFAILRPVVLIPLPLTEKFGLNTPASGFLEEFQVEAVLALLLAKDRDWLRERANTDEEAQSVLAWVGAMADLTEEQWKAQVEDQQRWLAEMSDPNRRKRDNG